MRSRSITSVRYEKLVVIVDPGGCHVLWARHPSRKLEWDRDVLPLAYASIEQLRRAPDIGSLGESSSDLKGDLPLAMAPVHIAEFSEGPCVAISTSSLRGQDLMEPLSSRERQVAELLIEGYANVNIAAQLELSENTIRTYVRRLYRKLRGLQQASARARDGGGEGAESA